MEQRDNMHNGKLYDPNDVSVMEEQMVCLDRLYDFNQTRPSEMDKRNAIMKEMMGDVGKDCYIEPPFHANWGGKHGIQYNMPIHIGENCWLGAGVIVVPGVTIGDNVVIGASSVVTKDIPSNSVAMGTPCRVVRQINDHDKEYYFKDKKIDWSEMQQFLD